MATLVPTEAELGDLPTKLYDGEKAVLTALQRLDDAWTVYVQPKLLLRQPDYIVTHPDMGAWILEVKGWARGIYRLLPSGHFEVLARGRWERNSEMPPLEQVHAYRSTLFERFFADPSSPQGDFKFVRGLLVLPFYNTDDARKLFDVAVGTKHLKHIEIVGGTELASDPARVLSEHMHRRPPERSMKRLARHLSEPEFSADQRRDLSFSDGARRLESNPDRSNIRRARGPAGSGKSIGLAGRAARLALEGKDVLVLSFNITLAHYLHDVAARHCRTLGAPIRRISFTHFHDLCRTILEVSGGRAAIGPIDDEGSDAVVASAKAACSSGSPFMFDAILVDEGQDFTKDWWNFLRAKVARPGAEMLLVVDNPQDIYERHSWVDGPMPDCGFSGNWTSLEGCYRLPADVIPVANAYARQFLDEQRSLPTAPVDRRGDAAVPTGRHWVDVDESELGAQAADAVVSLLERVDDLAHSDVALLTDSHAVGLTAVERLEGFGLAVSHVFTLEDDDERRRRKGRFWGGTDGIKGVTIHSFKGWEARAVVVALSGRRDALRLGYVALTRVKGDPAGRAAYLSVVNAHESLRGFGDQFRRVFTVEEVPALRGQQTLGHTVADTAARVDNAVSTSHQNGNDETQRVQRPRQRRAQPQLMAWNGDVEDGVLHRGVVVGIGGSGVFVRSRLGKLKMPSAHMADGRDVPLPSREWYLGKVVYFEVVTVSGEIVASTAVAQRKRADAVPVGLVADAVVLVRRRSEVVVDLPALGMTALLEEPLKNHELDEGSLVAVRVSGVSAVGERPRLRVVAHSASTGESSP